MRARKTAAERARNRQAMRVVHLVVMNWLAGAGLGALFAALLLWSDLGGIGRLMVRADPIWPPLLLLFGGFAVTFGSIVAGTAVMLIPKEDEPPEDPPGGRMIPVRVGAKSRNSRGRA